VVVSLHHQQTDNSAKYRRKTLSGLKPSFMCDISLSFFPLGAPVNVCATLLWGQEGHVHWRVTACCLFTWSTLNGILFVRGTGRNWTAGLVTTGCLVARLRLWQPWHTVRTFLNWTDVASSPSLSTTSLDI
jgi:hypothetical protein